MAHLKAEHHLGRVMQKREECKGKTFQVKIVGTVKYKRYERRYPATVCRNPSPSMSQAVASGGVRYQ
jgi:hypothetical protein